jgi:hypothetical protein
MTGGRASLLTRNHPTSAHSRTASQAGSREFTIGVETSEYWRDLSRKLFVRQEIDDSCLPRMWVFS